MDGPAVRAYPYENGGLNGSGWGYDEHKNVFIDNFYKKCKSTHTLPREPTAPFRCYKQDPMQSGAGHQEDGFYYSISSDFQNARIQRYFEGTTLNKGRMWEGVTPGGGFARWNPATQNFTDVDNVDTTMTPQVFNTKLTTAIFTLSCPELNCSTSGLLNTDSLNGSSVTQIYNPIEYTGDSRLFVDVDNVTQLDLHHYPKAAGDGRWEKEYCDTGCDFIGAFTFADGSKKRVMLARSFRTWRKPTEAMHGDSMNEVKGQSYKIMGAAVAGSDVTRVDLLYAPMAWEGVHARVPQLITSWTKDEGEVQPPKGVNSPSNPAHTFHYDVKLTVPPTADHCGVNKNLVFVRALEKAVFAVVGGGALPPLSHVKVKCICTGPSCGEGCERSYSYPEPVFPTAAAAAAAAAPAPAPAPAAVPWVPECGCSFTKFDGNSTCTGGGIHQSQLTRVEYAPGVYYYNDADGHGMMVQESQNTKASWYQSFDKDIDGMMAQCRSINDCAMAQFEIDHDRNKTHFKSAKCLSPCYVEDNWNRIGYHVDSTNEWAKSTETRNKVRGRCTS